MKGGESFPPFFIQSMIRTNIFDETTFPVPQEWIFETYLNLQEKLHGQMIYIRSVFNKKDKNPSMTIYVGKESTYRFTDFSTGNDGDAIDLVKFLYGLSTKQEAFEKILLEYNSNETSPYIEREIIRKEHLISDHETREWNNYDQLYWEDYYIGSEDLELHYVKPLKSYTFCTITGSERKEIKFEKEFCYGFFRSDGRLYKIYNTQEKKTKFIKVLSYIHGHDQLEYKATWLIILSSLKDCIAFKKLKFHNIEVIAPESENIMINEKQMNYYRSKYKFISVLFDNDKAGRKSAKAYYEKYKTPYTLYDVEKDIAESNKQHGIYNTRLFLKPFLLKTKNENIRTS